MDNKNKKNSDDVDFLELFGILYKNKLSIIITVIIAMIGAVVFSIITIKLPPEKSPLPNRFKPKSIVKINESESSGLSSIINNSGMGALAGLMGVPGAGTSNEASMVIMLTNSDSVIDQIADEFNLLEVYKLEGSKFPKSELRMEIKRHLSVVADLETNTMHIAYEDINNILATDIVNRVVDILEDKFADLDQTSNYSQRKVFEVKKSEVELEIALIQQKILDFQNKYNILDAKAISETIGNRIVFLKTSLVEKEAAIETYRSKSRIEDPALIKLKDEKKALENSLWALENGTIEGIPALRDLPLIVMEYEELTRSLQVQATIYQTLIQQYELLKLQEGGLGPKFQIIEYAEVPEMKSGPSRGKLCIIVSFAAFFFSIFLAFLKEFWTNLKNDPERMKKLKGQV